MRLAIVTRAVSRTDGQGRVNLEIAAEALARGHEVCLICERADQAVVASGATVQTLPPPAWLPGRLLRDQMFAWRSRAALARDFAAHGSVHGPAMVLANGFASWAGSDVNAVHFVHDAWLRSPHHPWRGPRGIRALYARLYSGVNTRLERIAFHRAATIVAVSGQVRRELEAVGVPPARIVTIPNGVDTAEFRLPMAGEKAAMRAKFGLPSDAVVALFAGELKTPRKNIDTLLQALAQAEDVHLAVAGSHEGTPWPAMAHALGIAGRVHFLGFQRAMPEIMRAADLFVFPSRYEPFGLVLLEALASGLPCITTARAGGAEIITEDVGIVLPDSEDAPSLTAAMRTIAGDAVRRQRMAAEARTLALEHGWQRMARRYLDLLQSTARRAAPYAAAPGGLSGRAARDWRVADA